MALAWPEGCDDFAPENVQQVKGPEGCLVCVFPCGWLASLILLAVGAALVPTLGFHCHFPVFCLWALTLTFTPLSFNKRVLSVSPVLLRRSPEHLLGTGWELGCGEGGQE